MATVIAASTVPNLDGVSRYSLFKKLALDTGMLFCGVVTEGGINSFQDTGNLMTSQGVPEDWIGGWFRASKTASHAAPEGQIAPVADYEPELGKIDLSTHLTGTLSPGDEYELWKINPKIAKDIADSCLTDDLYLPCWTVLSEVPDYDMEQPGTDDWSNFNSTVSKQTEQPRLSYSGKRYLRVVSSSPGGYAQSNPLPIEPRYTYQLSGVARCDAGSVAELVAWDNTNNVEIQSYPSNRQYPARIWHHFLAPENCRELSIRLRNQSTGTIDWDEISFHSVNGADIPLPWWVKNDTQVKGIFNLAPLSIGKQLWDATLRGEDDTRFDVIPNFGGYTRFKAQARQGLTTHPIFMFGSRNETPFESDVLDLKYLDINLFVACLKYRLYKFHSQPLVTGLLDAENFKSMLGPAEGEWMRISQSMSVELNKTLDSPTPWVEYIDHRFTYGEGR